MNETGTAEEAPLPSPAQGLPAVSALSRMAELMELAAARQMRRGLPAEQTSTAVRLSLWHLARIHSRPDCWRVVARRTAIRGRLHEFQVDVFDESGLIAGAEHTRAVVSAQRLEAFARRRTGRASMLLRA
jgi:predicted thioesterase